MDRYVYKRKPRKCPVCSSKKIASILYGMPALDEELNKEVAEKKVILAGCIISDDDPSWSCTDCEALFYNEGGAHQF